MQRNPMRKRFQKLFGTYTIGNILMVPYRSYATNLKLYVKGRVLDNEPLEMIRRQSVWDTVKNAFLQFDTHEIPGLTIALDIGGIRLTAISDRKGYFLFEEPLPIDLSGLADKEGWVSFTLGVTDSAYSTIAKRVTGEFLIPEKEADFGVISDIDDTILSTGVTSFLKWKVLRNSLFLDSYRRIPLEGAPALYQKLHFGVANKEKNPIFYLSNSPWNMYQYLALFLDHNGFPKGPVLLRSFSSMFRRLTAAEKPHKQKEIINLLNAFPALKFILIGDSGEHDATIYTDIAAQFPHRILCIYLRTVAHEGRMRQVRSIVDNFRTTPVLLVETSADAQAHARTQGYI
jgi:phosphatidate phosphatase APP1